jgi:hypothetical protein
MPVCWRDMKETVYNLNWEVRPTERTAEFAIKF